MENTITAVAAAIFVAMLIAGNVLSPDRLNFHRYDARCDDPKYALSYKDRAEIGCHWQ